jgi:hypothetical protein
MNGTKTDSGASAVLMSKRPSITDPEHNSSMSMEYQKGLIEGIKMYAWYDNGVLCVGPFGKTLERALAEIEMKYVQKRSGISMKA